MTDAWDGRPQNPERDGWHWASWRHGTPQATPAAWDARRGTWLVGINEFGAAHAARNWHYLGPCLLPSDVAAQVAAARREGIEAALAAARKVLCDAEQLDICEAVDAVGDACDAIRALLPGDAALARDFAAWTEGESDG